MILVLECGLLTIPDCVLFRTNTEQENNAGTQRKRFEAFNDFCKQNKLAPTPESLSMFLKLEAHYNTKKGE